MLALEEIGGITRVVIHHLETMNVCNNYDLLVTLDENLGDLYKTSW